MNNHQLRRQLLREHAIDYAYSQSVKNCRSGKYADRNYGLKRILDFLRNNPIYPLDHGSRFWPASLHYLREKHEVSRDEIEGWVKAAVEAEKTNNNTAK